MAPDQNQRPQGRNNNPWRQIGVVLSLVFTIPAAVAVGGLVGLWLDGKAGTEPLFTLVLIAAGFVAGLREVLREIKRMNRNNQS